MITDQNIDIIYYPGMSRIPLCITGWQYHTPTIITVLCTQYAVKNSCLQSQAQLYDHLDRKC